MDRRDLEVHGGCGAPSQGRGGGGGEMAGSGRSELSDSIGSPGVRGRSHRGRGTLFRGNSVH